MCSRGVWQLKALLVRYCEHGGSSAGVRKFLEKALVPFAEANPQIQVCVSKRPNRHPFVQGWYVRDRDKQLSLKNLSMEQVAERVQLLRDMRPIGLSKWARPFRSPPSIQGEWQMGQILDRPHTTIRAR